MAAGSGGMGLLELPERRRQLGPGGASRFRPADPVLYRCCPPSPPEATRVDLDTVLLVILRPPLPLSLYPAPSLELNLLKKAPSEFTEFPYYLHSSRGTVKCTHFHMCVFDCAKSWPFLSPFGDYSVSHGILPP